MSDFLGNAIMFAGIGLLVLLLLVLIVRLRRDPMSKRRQKLEDERGSGGPNLP